MHMKATRKVAISVILSVLMFSSVTTGAISSYKGPSILSGNSSTISDAFEIPGNTTVIDAWINVDESGYLNDGSGYVWNVETVGSNFSNGQFSNTMVGKFEGAMSLSPNSSVSNVDTFSSSNLQLPSAWSHVGGLWGAANPSLISGSVSGQTRSLPHGNIPASASNGAIVAATLPGQGLPANSFGSMISPQYNIPSPIQDFNLTFSHWHHLDSNDGAWVEYRLDNGSWSHISPTGGYPHSISNNSVVSGLTNISNSIVFGDGNHSGWVNSTINLDNITGLSNATNLQFRFRVWTDSTSVSRPGWYVDNIYLTNNGNSTGYWHHGCFTQTSSSCYYSNNANGVMETGINLSGTSSGSKIKTKLQWDLEGSSYDNFCVELSTNNGSSWTDISSSSTSTSSNCRYRSGAIPGSGYTLPNGSTLGDDSGGFVILEFPIPQAMYGSNNTSKIRYVVNTDGSSQYGYPNDNLEGLTVEWFRLIDSSGNVTDETFFSSQSSAIHYPISGGNDDWAFIQIGAGQSSTHESFESSSTNNATYPIGWTETTQSGQTGWEFGSLCTSYSDGPSSFPSANVGFGTDLCGDYDSSADNSLITPDYYVPLGASASFVWKHWMCAEEDYDGGELFMSTNSGPWSKVYLNYANGSNWYDGQTNGGTDVWDGRQHVGFSSCSSSFVTIPWMDMSYDVSNLSGNNVSFRFRHTSDYTIQEAGWYIDDVGLTVDWFETEGSWRSPGIPVHELGYGFVDADIFLPSGTWYGVNVLDGTGSVIDGHTNLSLPISLASIDREVHSSIQIEVLLGTQDPYYSPLIKEISVGSTRYFGEDNGWNIPSTVSRLANGSWQNTGSSTAVINGETAFSSRPISSVNVTGNFSQTSVSLLTSTTQSISTNLPNSFLDFGRMKSDISPRVTMSPGAVIDSLSMQGIFAQPTVNAVIDLANDGNVDWQFDSSQSYGALGWQNKLYTNPSTYSINTSGNTSISVLLPKDATPKSLLLGLTPNGEVGPLLISSGPNNLYQLNSANWTTSVVAVSNPSLHSIGNIVDASGRNWSTIDLEFTTSSQSNYTITSISIGYNLLENVSGLGQVVKTYHEANSNNGLASIVDIPLTWETSAGGIAIDGGVYHENMITNHPFNVPTTWYPNQELQGFTTQHHHLLNNDLITEIQLTGKASSGEEVIITISNISSAGTFVQTSGAEILKLSNSSTVAEIGGRIVASWQFEVDWDWDDSQSVLWSVQAYDANGEGMSPAIAQSGEAGNQASENDLEIDSWQIADMSGNLLSDEFSPSYPFYAKAGTKVSISGSVKFQNTIDIRPKVDDFVVAVTIDGSDIALSSSGDGTWTGLVTLPNMGEETNIIPYIVRAGPITGANGAQDETSTNPVKILLDSMSPWAKDLLVDTGNRLKPADGFTWDPSSPLNLQVTITDDEALGEDLKIHYWREGIDDHNLNGLADESEYEVISKPLPEGLSGERTVSFGGIDLSEMDFNAQCSIYFTSQDFAGHSLRYGGYPGLGNDMATLIVAINEPTTIPTAGISLDTVNEQLLAGQMHTLVMEINDENGVNSIDIVEINMAGNQDDGFGLMVWEPRNGDFYTGNNSQLVLHDVSTNFIGDSNWQVSWNFSLDWDFDSSRLQEYSLPSIIVYDDDELNPVVVISNIGEIRWQLDNNLQVIVENITDTTPPISKASPDHIFVQPGDDLTFTGHISYQKSGAVLKQVPPQGLEVEISTIYGSENLNSYGEVQTGGMWEAGLILPSRSIIEPIMSVEYSITGVVSPGQDITTTQSLITVDEIAPTVQFSTIPLVIDDDELESLQFAVIVTDEGGLPSGGLPLSWAYLRNGVAIQDGSLESNLPLISSNGASYSYAGNIDFTSGMNLSFQQGDELVWWFDVTDKAGNDAAGTGLSSLDPMRTEFTIRSFDVSVTNIEISLANGKVPRGNEVVEGTEIGIVVHVRNLGTKSGTVNISLMEDTGMQKDWVNHGEFELSLLPGRTLNTPTILFETYGSGSQGLFVNISGYDVWISNYLMPNCFEYDEVASCDLGTESDMPRVISQDDVDSGFSGMSVVIAILGLLLIIAGFAIVILIRKDNDDESIFYDDDDWEEETAEELTPKIYSETNYREGINYQNQQEVTYAHQSSNQEISISATTEEE